MSENINEVETDTKSENESQNDNTEILEEMEKIVKNGESIHAEIENAIRILKNIENKLQTDSDFFVMYKNKLTEFEEVLKIIKNESLENLEKNSNCIFGQLILDIIDSQYD